MRRRRRSGGRRARRGSARWTSRKERPSSSTTEGAGWAPAAAARPTGGCRSVPRAGRARTRSRCRGSRWRGGASASVGLLRSSGSASPRRSARSRRPTRRSESCRRVAAPRGRPARPPRLAAPPSRPATPPLPRLSPRSSLCAARAHPPARGERQAAAQGGGVRAQHRRDVRRDRGTGRVPDLAPRTHRFPQLTPRPSLCRTWSSRRRRCGRRRRTRSR